MGFWIILLIFAYGIIGTAAIRILDNEGEIDAEDAFVILVLIFPLILAFVFIRWVGENVARIFEDLFM